ncbi:MAG TPA: glutamate--cysteine ligase [Gammaproteobacteria bacterium]|nr:glutamate--cysteine ligase [Gammaproteobacteria bacterium]
MGQEIDDTRFSRQDFTTFQQRLSEETALLGECFQQGRFDPGPPVAGFELEAWLVDAQLRPAPVNARFIERLGNPLVSPELATFNIEFNIEPLPLSGHILSRMASDLQQTWQQARQTAHEMQLELAITGILPTVRDADLCPANLSAMNRYHALNTEILRLRGGRPLHLDIHGHDILRAEHSDVMLESATTSFQIHLQVAPELALRAYNASIIASAPLLAVSANSPYLFGHDLWAETRIPLFEQAVEVGGYEEDAHGPMRRVSFGSGYARASLQEIFTENLEHFPTLLPMLFEAPPEQLTHLRLHNGTLWRWNRPLIGFTPGPQGDKLHLRIEQRVVPAGPTIADTVANAAFFYGLCQALSQQDEAAETRLPFATARDNFYAAARHGLDAQITWLDGDKQPAQSLLLRTLLPLATQGLEILGIDHDEATHYLGIIESRVKNACNGAAWQRAYAARHGSDMQALLAAYLERQHSGVPVHEWDI